MAEDVRDNTAQHRFELDVGGYTAFANCGWCARRSYRLGSRASRS